MEPVHFHFSNPNSKTNLFLLLVPAIVFVLVLGFALRIQKNGISSNTEVVSVLGESVEKVDNNP